MLALTWRQIFQTFYDDIYGTLHFHTSLVTLIKFQGLNGIGKVKLKIAFSGQFWYPAVFKLGMIVT